jgi:23S rRNA (cytidine1920-2'-O)/16S rRNA (cytidine1409-2'-O)-methyltransferase
VSARRRLDAELVRRGLAKSRVEARTMVESGRVLVGGVVAIKVARLVAAAEPVVVEGPRPTYVGRGGEKLEHALTTFGIDVAGWVALDAGASTGGFTDCLLQRGARHVVAVDVGHGQLHERLRADERVTNVERTNVRGVTTAVTGGPVDIVVADLSFISLTMVIGALAGVCKPGAPMVLLVKPQFEAGRTEASRGRGVITDPAIWDRVRSEITDALVGERCEVSAWTVSPITGAEGNREFLVHARAPMDIVP